MPSPPPPYYLIAAALLSSIISIELWQILQYNIKQTKFDLFNATWIEILDLQVITNVKKVSYKTGS